jgi:uncharacterized protein (DUF58 family)
MATEIEIFRFSTKRNLLLFAISFSLAAGLAFNVRPLIFLGECLLVLAVVSYALSGGRREAFHFTREHHPRCFEDDLVNVQLRCVYTGRIGLDLVEIRDTFSPGQAYFVHNLVTEPMRPSHELQLTYENLISHRRGLYTIGPVRLSCTDSLGIFRHDHEFDLFTSLYVYPKVPVVDHFDLLEEGTLRHVGQEVYARAGRSELFRAIREYRPGDPLNLVHWPSTAHHGRPMIKEFDDNVVTDVSIFLDLHRLSLRGIGDVTSVEYIIKAAAATVRAAIARSHRVQVFALAHHADHIPPAGGWPHLLTVLDRMTLYRASGEHDFADEVRRRIALLPRGGTVVWIVSATNFDLDRCRPLVERLIADPMKVIAILIDDRSFLKLFSEQEVLHVRRPPLRAIVDELKRLGCRVVTAASGDDLRVRMELVE